MFHLSEHHCGVSSHEVACIPKVVENVQLDEDQDLFEKICCAFKAGQHSVALRLAPDIARRTCDESLESYRTKVKSNMFLVDINTWFVRRECVCEGGNY
jgi:hypothetical protein